MVFHLSSEPGFQSPNHQLRVARIPFIESLPQNKEHVLELPQKRAPCSDPSLGPASDLL